LIQNTEVLAPESLFIFLLLAVTGAAFHGVMSAFHLLLIPAD